MADEPDLAPEEPLEEPPERVAPPAPRRKRPPAPKSPLSDDDVDRIAARFNEMNIDSLRDAGAFDAPVEPVAAPAQPAAPPEPGAPGEPALPAPHIKRTFAHRYLGQV